MINGEELRLGNYILQKAMGKISVVKCNLDHFQLLGDKGANDLYPIVLKAEWLEKSGFIENKEYPLLPEAREFVLTLPVIGSNKNEIFAYIKNNKECFGRATVNGLPASNNFYNLHQLQNIYFALTGAELQIKL